MKLPHPLALLVDAVLPPRCPGCGSIVDGDGRFCTACWQGLDFLPANGCEGCNLPLDAMDGSLCGRCLRELPKHGRVHAAVAYGDVASTVVLRLKYARRPAIARTIAELVAHDVDFGPNALLVPVPLHRRRLWQRGYNQAGEIAWRLGRRRGIEVDLTAIMRVRATPPLRGLGPQARDRAVRGAFRAQLRCDGRHVVLVDDVYTTGSTVNACARAAYRAGADQVSVICWARVLPED